MSGSNGKTDDTEWTSHNVRVVDGDKPGTGSWSGPVTPDDVQLRDWWLKQAQIEIDRTVPKSVEYGGHKAAVDLIWIGREMAANLGRDDVTDEEATELGIYFYLLGKVGRWSAAIREGKRVSDDTLFDISVYCRMAQRNRQVGGWPFGSSQV